MIFNPQNMIQKEGSFFVSENVSARAHSCLDKNIIKEFWKNFTFQASSLSIVPSNEFVFSVGKADKLPLDGNAYSINITPDGVCVFAENENDLIYGFMTLIDRFAAVDLDEKTAVELSCVQIKDRALIQNRMIHFCIFPETALWELQRFVRLCGALKYTHIILEFWGTLQYDCMKELAWKSAFTKEDIRPIIYEANALGLEIIPMFNHWGHASAGRVRYGKHVVLDQNPTLQTYFSEDGWCWDIRKPKVRALLHQIREELIELCGEGSYFHIGCDEAYNFEFTDDNMALLCELINEANDHMLTKERRVIVWGDMFLYRHGHYNPENKYTCNAPTPHVEEYMLSHLNKQIVIADWQYKAVAYPVETVDVFKNAGFECLLCPWDEGRAQIDSALATVQDKAIMGYMHTTWHTLSLGMPFVVLMALGGFEDIKNVHFIKVITHAAALLRKVMPIGGEYEKAGWNEKQVYAK